jgi:hypothetical protein
VPRRYVFADEAGDFEFSKKAGASKYFILCTVTCDGPECGLPLLGIRRQLAWDKDIDTVLHASSDAQEVRDVVYPYIQTLPIRVDATILEKCKADPNIRPTEERFYQYAWFYHFRYVAPKICNKLDELAITVASLSTKKKRDTFRALLKDVAKQSLKGVTFKTAFWPAASDPCLQIADYCAWAIQRKWESKDQKDVRSYDLIQDKIKTEFDLFAWGKKTYY